MPTIMLHILMAAFASFFILAHADDEPGGDEQTTSENRPRKQVLIWKTCNLATDSQTVMDDCCPPNERGHHRHLQLTDGCELPKSCVSKVCASSFKLFYALCNSKLRS